MKNHPCASRLKRRSVCIAGEKSNKPEEEHLCRVGPRKDVIGGEEPKAPLRGARTPAWRKICCSTDIHAAAVNFLIVSVHRSLE